MRNNKIWSLIKPYISIIIPNYNRKNEFIRAFKSVCNIKTKIPIEVIIVDDGSSVNMCDEYEYCLSTEYFPVCLLEKDNGGVHTARNLGVLIARGEFCIFLDSDDELLPDSIDSFIAVLNTIPNNKIQSLFEIKFRCKNENGFAVSKEIKANINQLPKEKQAKIINNFGEMIGVRKTSVLKNNPFPEPMGITFVMENILWDLLRTKYDSWYSNTIIRVYHTETNDKLTSVKKKTIQHCRNRCWNYCYLINNSNLYKNETKNKVKCIFIYSMFRALCKNDKATNIEMFKLKKRTDRMLDFFIKPISTIAAKMYKYKYLS